MKQKLLVGLVVVSFQGLVGMEAGEGSFKWAAGPLSTPPCSPRSTNISSDSSLFFDALKKFGDDLEKEPEKWIGQISPPKDFFRNCFGFDPCTETGMNALVLYAFELKRRSSKLPEEYGKVVENIARSHFLKAKISPYLYSAMRIKVDALLEE